MKGLQKGMAYVMLGRSSRLQDIFIAGELDVNEIKCDPNALEESNRLDEMFDQSVEKEQERRSQHWKISYLNVRSMKAADGHAKDVAKDNFIMDSDIFGLGETWLEEDQEVHFEGFSGYFANFGSGKGIAGYSNLDLVAQPERYGSETYSAMMLKTSNFHIVFLYLSKNYDRQGLSYHLNLWIEEDVPTAVIGDINENLLKMPMKEAKFAKMMKQKGFHQLIKEPTCHTGSLIDHLYVNNAMKALNISSQTDPAYYSDHDIISLYIPKL